MIPVDFATCYPKVVSLKSIDTETIAEALVNIFSHFGVPEEILRDLGTQFVSDYEAGDATTEYQANYSHSLGVMG